ncbi:MAG: hypothetical protein SNH27_07390 [Rikenellaceae bacterium]
MDKIDRYKVLVRYAVSNGIAPSQKGLGKIMGYSNESSFSQILNEKVDQPKDFISRLVSIIPDLNEDWIENGNGEMLRTEQKIENNSENNSGVSNISGNGHRIKNEVTTPVATDTTIDKILKEMSEERKAHTAQVDKLLAQLEAQNRLIEKLMDK